MSGFRSLFRIGLLLSLFAWFAGPSTAAEKGVSPFHVTGSGGRVELLVAPTDGSPPQPTIRAGRLILTFAREPLPPIGDLETRLQEFVAGIGSDPATRRLRFLLRSGTEVAVAEEGEERLRISFRRKDAARAAIGVRIGRHPDFLRLVFEGPEAATAALQREDRRIVLRFARPLGNRVPARLEALEPLAGIETPRGDRVVLRLAEGYGAKVLRLPPDRLVLDLVAEAPPAAAAKTARADPGRSGAPASARTGETVAAATGPATGAGKPVAGPAAAGKPETAPAGATATAAGSRNGQPATAEEPAPRPTPPGPAPSGEAGPVASSSAPSRPAAVSAGPAAAGADAGPLPDGVPAAADLLEIRAAREGETVVLRFLWPFEVGAAAFLRGGRLWVVFDAATRSLVAEKKKIAFHAGALIRSLRQETHDRATVLRIDLRRTVAISMRREGNVWVLRFGESAVSAITPKPQADPGGLLFPDARRSIRFRDSIAGDEMRVLTYVRGGAGLPRPRRLVDLALLETAQGVAWRAIAADVEARPVPGGILLTRPGGLRLDAAATADTRRPERPSTSPDAGSEPPGGSATSDAPPAITGEKTAPESPASTPERKAAAEPPAAAEAGAEVPAPIAEGATAPVDGGESGETRRASAADPPATGLRDPPWKTTLGLAELPPEVLRETDRLRRALLAELVQRAEPERAPLRLRIARLYLADALSAEAFAQLLATNGAAAVDGDPLLAKRRAALAGASSLLLGRNGVAAEHLRNPLLTEDRETSLWRAVLAARENRWDVAAEELARGGEILRAYPPALRFRLGLVAVMIAAQNGDARSAFDWLKQLEGLELDTYQRDELRFVEALTLSRDGAAGEARRLLARLAEEAGWLTATKAAYALVNLDREAGRIDDAGAREAFLRQRPFWRGHPWEPTMLREFGRLERRLNRIPEALAVWRELLGRYPDSAASSGLAGEMGEALAEALAPGAEAALPLFARLELYRRYIALVPTGEKGDRIVLDLAKGLLETGLPELADKLASERLPVAAGEPQRRAFAHLRARAALAAGSPERARELAAKLAASGSGEDALRGRLLAARAQLEQGNPWGALATLRDISDPRALAIRIDAHWAAREWKALASLAEPLLAEITPRKLLSEEEAVRALRVGAALARRGERERVLEIARLVAARSDLARVETLFELMTTPVALTGDPAAVIAGIGRLADRLRTGLAYLQAGDGGLAPAAAAGGF